MAFLTKEYTKSVDGAEKALQEINELFTKYKFMEAKLLQQKRSMGQKIPEIQLAIDSLVYIESKNGEEIKTSFEVSECAIVQATITKSDSVLLWLGANVMVEYPHAEALALLNNNLASAKSSSADIITQLAFLKDQITVCEVNVARIHNWKVEQNAAAKNGSPAVAGPQRA